MYPAVIKLLLLLSIIVENEHTVCACNGPKIRLSNGTVLDHYANIYWSVDEPLDLYCTGEVENLQMTEYDPWASNDVRKLPTTVVNKTTIRLFVQRPELGSQTYYKCIDITDPDSRKNIVVTILPVPKTTKFSCQSKNLDYLNCTWTMPEKVGEFKYSLCYAKDGSCTPLCSVSQFQLYKVLVCLWDISHPLIPYDTYADTLSFMLKTCNRLGCTNQTFTMDHHAVLKLDPPEQLRLVGKSSHSATLRWRTSTSVYYGGVNSRFDTKINYWYSGHQQFIVNAPLLRDYSLSYDIKLKLPCAKTYYEVRVSMRPRTAIAEGIWSDNATISFITDPDPNNVDAVEPVCEPEEIELSPEIMEYEIAKLRAKITGEQKQLKQSIRGLESKQRLNDLDGDFV